MIGVFEAGRAKQASYEDSRNGNSSPVDRVEMVQSAPHLGEIHDEQVPWGVEEIQ